MISEGRLTRSSEAKSGTVNHCRFHRNRMWSFPWEQKRKL